MQEKQVANDTGGQVVPASGALQHSKADVNSKEEVKLVDNTPIRCDSEKIECKYTLSHYYTLKFNDLLRLRIQAAKDSAKIPIFVIEFQGQNKGNYVLEFVPEFLENLPTLQTRAKSITLIAGDLLYSAVKIKDGPILGIKFYDYEKKLWRQLTITTYQRWLDGRSSEAN